MIMVCDKQSAQCDASLLKQIDAFRQAASETLDPDLRPALGQYLTPLSMAIFMASLFSKIRKNLHLIDAGAGAGILSAATICAYLERKNPPSTIKITAFEIDPKLTDYLQQAYELCATVCRKRNVLFEFNIIKDDFINYAVNVLRADMFAPA